MKYNKLILITFIVLVVIALIYFIYLQTRPTFHILVATAGRPELRNLLDSLRGELNSGDAITIVFDGDKSRNKSGINSEWLKGHNAKITIIEQVPSLGHWGHGIRNKYQDILEPRCTFIMHADDDDEYISGSFNKLRWLCSDKNTLYVAKMIKTDDETTEEVIIPRQNNEIIFSDIGTPNGIVPTPISGKSEWAHKHGGDYYYYKGLEQYARVVFLKEIIYKAN